jgi:hypothetical protein
MRKTVDVRTLPRPTCPLSYCDKPVARRYWKRRNGETNVGNRPFCTKHWIEYCNGGIYIAEDEDWDA